MTPSVDPSPALELTKRPSTTLEVASRGTICDLSPPMARCWKSSGGGVFIVAGGAPLYLSTYDAIGGPRPGVHIDGWDIDHTDNPAAHLRAVPADGTLLESSGGGVFIVAGGAPLYVSTYDAIGGPRPGVHIDGWDIDHTDNPAAHFAGRSRRWHARWSPRVAGCLSSQAERRCI